MTPAQRHALQNASDWMELNAIEFEMDYGYRGAALSAVVKSCIKRGWLDESRALTEAGRAALAKVTP